MEVNPLENTLRPLATASKTVLSLSRNHRRRFVFLPLKTFYKNLPFLRGISTRFLIKSAILHILDVRRRSRTLRECTTIDSIEKQLQFFWF